MATIDGKLKEILTKYHPAPRDAVWDCHGKWVAYHAALEEIARNAKIVFDPPQVLEASGDTKCVAICVTGRINGSAVEWSIGEASPHNYRTTGKQAAYPFAMAEKRAKDRVILKLIGLHGMVYSEEEADDFKGEGPKPEVAPPSIRTPAPAKADAPKGIPLADPSGAVSFYQKASEWLDALQAAMETSDPGPWWMKNKVEAEKIAKAFPQAVKKVREIESLAMAGA